MAERVALLAWGRRDGGRRASGDFDIFGGDRSPFDDGVDIGGHDGQIRSMVAQGEMPIFCRKSRTLFLPLSLPRLELQPVSWAHGPCSRGDAGDQRRGNETGEIGRQLEKERD